MAGLKAQWLGWSGRFAALQKREKLMVAGAILFTVLYGGYMFWIEPAQLKKGALHKAIAQQQAELGQLGTQLVVLAKQSADPAAPHRAVLAEVQRGLDDTERDIHGFDRVLVAPAEASALLQTLLSRHRGLALVSLTTLPPQPLVTRPQKPGEAENETARNVAPPGANIYKHGIEIRIAGGYHDLLAYVGELEGGPQKLLWGGMKLAVQKYPVSELTLTVFTLSLDSIWLAV